MNDLTLDLGTTTGWCAGNRKTHISGVWQLKPGRFESQSSRLVKLLGELDKLHAVFKFKKVWFEEVRRHLGTDAAHWYGAFWGLVIKWCDDNRIPYEGVPVGEIKRGFTGKGNAPKEAMMAEAARRGYTPVDDNEADAIALFLLKAEEITDPKIVEKHDDVDAGLAHLL